MKAPSEILQTSTLNADRDITRAIRRLAFRRRLFRAGFWISLTIAALLFTLIFVGFADHVRPLGRPLRTGIVALLFSAMVAVAGRIIWQLVHRESLTQAARLIEERCGNSSNTLVSYAELSKEVSRPSETAYVTIRLERRAREEIKGVDISKVAPSRPVVLGIFVVLVSLLVLLGLRFAAPSAYASEISRLILLVPDAVRDAPNIGLMPMASPNSGSIDIQKLTIRVTPPSYSGLGVTEFSGDAPIRVLANSQLIVEARATGPATGAELSYGGRASTMRLAGEDNFSGNAVASASGALEVKLTGDKALPPPPIVRGVEVYSDAPPEIRISEPTADQLLGDVPAQPITVRWAATDDLGLAGISLKYIRSRGDGDAAKFLNGEVAIPSFDRAGLREWRGTAALDIARLHGQPGDTFVFWLEAKDRNPYVNNIGRSGSLVIALASPELTKLNLGDLRPNDIARYLLSERQIIINTEQLHNTRNRLSKDAFMKRANELAADQREFKNSFSNFINVEGAGESAGENASVEERAQSSAQERTEIHNHGIPDPPQGTPESVRDMIQSIRAMWDAEDSLSLGDTSNALAFEHEALSRLKRAQLAARYIPPILPKHTPLDLKRRYQGELADIKTQLEKISRLSESRETAPLREALADAYEALRELQATIGAAAGGRASALARARERTRKSADRITGLGGPHSVMIAEAAGQLRIVENELSRIDAGGSPEGFSEKLEKPLALLTQAASSLYAVAGAKSSAGVGDAPRTSSGHESGVADYFRRLAGGKE